MSTSKIAPHRGTEVFEVIMGTKPLGSVPLDGPRGRAVLDAPRLYTHVKNGEVYFALTEGPLNAFIAADIDCDCIACTGAVN